MSIFRIKIDNLLIYHIFIIITIVKKYQSKKIKLHKEKIITKLVICIIF